MLHCYQWTGSGTNGSFGHLTMQNQTDYMELICQENAPVKRAFWQLRKAIPQTVAAPVLVVVLWPWPVPVRDVWLPMTGDSSKAVVPRKMISSRLKRAHRKAPTK